MIAPGWYADPEYVGTERFWDGTMWTAARRTAAPVHQAQQPWVIRPNMVGLGLLSIAVVGLILSYQTVSLATGEGIIWTGVVLAVFAAVVAWTWGLVTRFTAVVATVIALLCLANAFYVAHQLDQRRQQIQRELNSFTP